MLIDEGKVVNAEIIYENKITSAILQTCGI